MFAGRAAAGCDQRWQLSMEFFKQLVTPAQLKATTGGVILTRSLRLLVDANARTVRPLDGIMIQLVFVLPHP